MKTSLTTGSQLILTAKITKERNHRTGHKLRMENSHVYVGKEPGNVLTRESEQMGQKLFQSETVQLCYSE
jgi:hypothetical protein